ncbi:HS12B-like protein, partial [Mya arenaria]
VNSCWTSGFSQLMSLKTSTSVLLNSAGEFHSFGFEAEEAYADLAEDGEHGGWRLFRRFKMMLHNNTQLNRHSTIEDIQGNPEPALPIFTHAIHYLPQHVAGIPAAQLKLVLEPEVASIWCEGELEAAVTRELQ